MSSPVLPSGVQYHLNRGVAKTIWEEFPLAPMTSSLYAMPSSRVAPEGHTINWHIQYTGGNPTAVDVRLEGSYGGGNPVWFTIDTSTVVGGEFRKVTNVKCPAIRVRVVSNTGGSSISVYLTV